MELSAFIVIVWCIYRLNRALKVSALISTIVTEATVYFLVMVAVQVYSIIGVSRSLGSLAFWMVKCDHCRASLTKRFYTCE